MTKVILWMETGEDGQFYRLLGCVDATQKDTLASRVEATAGPPGGAMDRTLGSFVLGAQTSLRASIYQPLKTQRTPEEGLPDK